MGTVTPDTLCSFVADANSAEMSELPGEDELLADVSGPAIGIEEGVSMGIIRTTSSSAGISLWPWVNQVDDITIPYEEYVKSNLLLLQTPLTVTPQLPLEIVMQLFKRMGYVRKNGQQFHSF
jgi:chloride channel 3/4/5